MRVVVWSVSCVTVCGSLNFVGFFPLSRATRRCCCCGSLSVVWTTSRSRLTRVACLCVCAWACCARVPTTASLSSLAQRIFALLAHNAAQKRAQIYRLCLTITTRPLWLTTSRTVWVSGCVVARSFALFCFVFCCCGRSRDQTVLCCADLSNRTLRAKKSTIDCVHCAIRKQTCFSCAFRSCRRLRWKTCGSR